MSGEPCRVVGTVSMDAFAVELEDQEPVGAPVTILGHGVLAEDHARVAGTINYELACGIEPRPAAGAGGPSSMRDLVDELFAGEEAWVVGGAVRDHALGRPIVDLDVALRDPAARGAEVREAIRRRAVPALGAPRRLARRSRGRAHGRLHAAAGRRSRTTSGPATSPSTRIAERVGTDETVDPFDGYGDLAARRIRSVKDSVFEDDPLRLLRAVRGSRTSFARLQDGSRDRGARAPRRSSGDDACGERDPGRAAPALARRLPARSTLWGCWAARRRNRQTASTGWDSADYRLVAVFGGELRRLPVSNELRRLATALVRAERPQDDPPLDPSFPPGATEPWSLEALAFVGASGLRARRSRRRRKAEPEEPLLRGDELGLPPGPEIGAPARADRGGAGGGYDRLEGGSALDYARPAQGAVREDG